MNKRNLPIGFLDSGVGGISVLREACKLLQNEDFIYFGDSKNAPYGIKTDDEIRSLTLDAAKLLISKGVKALVIACNTATAVAINTLRETYKDIPIIGIEPAVKPAVENSNHGNVVIMATPMTLKKEKFHKLISKYEEECTIISMPCPELVTYVESGILEGDIIHNYIEEKFNGIDFNEIKFIVLGCTHFPFIKKELSTFIDEYKIIDGSYGTAKNLKFVLEKNNLTNNSNEKGRVEIINSSDNKAMLKLSRSLLNL